MGTSANDRSILTPNVSGLPFRSLEPHSTRPEFAIPLDFKFHQASKETIQSMDASIAYAFGSDINIFDTGERSNLDHSQVYKFLRTYAYPIIGAPVRYFQLWSEYFESKYPGESDARAYLATYRELYFQNQVVLILLKRLILIAALVAVFWPFWLEHFVSKGTMRGDLLSAVSLLIGVIFFFAATLIVSRGYRAAHKLSSAHASSLIQARLSDLSRFFDNTITDIDRAGAHIGRQPDEWNEQAKFLVRLALYIGRRIEYFERYVQLEMWQVSRFRFWTLLGGLTSTLLIIGFFEAMFLLPQLLALTESIGKTSLGELGFPILVEVGLFVCRAACLVLLPFYSMMLGRVSISAVSDAMQSTKWSRFSELRLDEELGSQVGRDKRLLAQAAQQHIFPQGGG